MLAYFFGGISFFLYGQFLLEQVIQNAGRVYLRVFLKLLTGRRDCYCGMAVEF